MTDWDRVHKGSYESKAFSSTHWIWEARTLLDTASLLEAHLKQYWDSLMASQGKTASGRNISGIYFMLMGFAVENLLKAAVIRDKGLCFRNRFKEDEVFPDKLHTHKLVDLAKKAQLQFDRKEEDLLRRLTRNATWQGRYPVPLNYKELSGLERFDDGKEYGVSHYTSIDVELAKQLVQKIITELKLA